MSVYNVTFEYNEPRTAVIKVETPHDISEPEAEDLAMEQFELKFPEIETHMVDILEVEEIRE